MNRTSRRIARGFTITEIIVVVIIIGVLAAVIAPRLLGRVGQSKQATAASGAATLATAMSLYANDMGGLPEPGATVEVLLNRPADADEASWKGPYVQSAQALLDPWGNMYVLRIPGEVNVDYDIVSFGKDGQPGGEGENQDIVNGQKIN